MDESISDQVQERYGAIAKDIMDGTANQPGCGCGCGDPADLVSSGLYDATDAASVPQEAVLASLGCGNPTALAELHEGETVLDLGSGGGIDVLLSARRVGPSGRAIGLDFTDEMLELARTNQRRSGLTNVEFLKGSIEAVPLPDRSVDVIISNCVINLAADKGKVLAEAFRVLRPGGRFAISDILARRAVEPAVRRSVELWIGCVAGALSEPEYRELLGSAGFEDVGIEPTRVYEIGDAKAFARSAGVTEAVAQAANGGFMGAFVRARRPA